MAGSNNPGLSPGLYPLAYMGVNPTTPPNFYIKNYPPTANDGTGYQRGSIWLNIGPAPLQIPTAQSIWMLVSQANNVNTWVQLGAPGLQTLRGNDGNVVPASSGTANPPYNTNIVGAGGVVVTGNTATNTLTITVGGEGMTWNNIVATPINLVSDNGYVMSFGTQVVATLPSVSAFGDIIWIVGNNAAGWKIAQGAGQSIRILEVSTTVGVTGYLESNGAEPYDTLQLLCIVANTTWTVISSVGNIVYN